MREEATGVFEPPGTTIKDYKVFNDWVLKRIIGSKIMQEAIVRVQVENDGGLVQEAVTEVLVRSDVCYS